MPASRGGGREEAAGLLDGLPLDRDRDIALHMATAAASDFWWTFRPVASPTRTRY